MWSEARSEARSEVTGKFRAKVLEPVGAISRSPSDLGMGQTPRCRNSSNLQRFLISAFRHPMIPMFLAPGTWVDLET